MILALYIASFIPDFFFVSGSVYLVEEKHWDPWWILVGVVLAYSCFPQQFLDKATSPTPATKDEK